MASDDQCCDLAFFADGSPPEDRHKRAIGQRVIASFSGPFPVALAQALIQDFCIGSVLLNASNFTDATQPSQLVPQLTRFSAGSQPILVGIEHGSGAVSQFPTLLSLGAGHSRSNTVAIGKAIGKELAAIGIDWLLAPNIEAITELTEPLDTTRRFGDNAKSVSQCAQAFLEGLSTTGVATCPEASLAAILQEMYRSIDEDVDIEDLMELTEVQAISRLQQTRSLERLHLTSSISEYDDLHAAQWSFQTVLQRLLRDRLGYRGLITVASEFRPRADVGPCATHAPLRTLLSGSDLAILPTDPDTQRESIQAIYAAVGTPIFPFSALHGAADRISLFGSQNPSGALRPTPALEPNDLAQQHRSLIQESYRASTTALSTGPSPLLGIPTTSILLLLTPSVPPLPGPNYTPNVDPFEPLGRAIARFHNRTRHVPYTLSAGVTSTHAAFLERAAAIVLVLCNTSSAFVETQVEFVRAVQDCLQARESQPGEQEVRKIALAAGDPRDLRKPLDGWWEICCYEYTPGALEAATEVLLGQRTATGTLPIRLGRNLNGQ